MKKNASEITHAIKESSNALGASKKQVKLTEERIHLIFEQLRLLLSEREAELLAEIEKEVQLKEQESLTQKNDLESLLQRIHDLGNFSERLVTEGNGVEIAGSHNPVIARFESLQNEMKKAPFSPVTIDVIEFLEEGEAGVEESKTMLKGIGAIAVKGAVSAEKSRVVRSENENDSIVSSDQRYSCDLILVDHKGDTVTGTVPITAGMQVRIDGPSKDVEVILIIDFGWLLY